MEHRKGEQKKLRQLTELLL